MKSLARTVLGPGAVALGLAALGCSSPTGGPGLAHTIEPEALYTSQCARCHGPDGKGVAGLKATLPISDLTDPRVRALPNQVLEQVVMAGRNQMPAFGDSLSLPKIQAVVGYVKRLGTP